jgi:hypothetical protein
MVKIENGLVFSEASGARYFDMAAIATTEDRINNPITPVIPEDKMPSMPWSPWGSNNLLPMEMAVDIETCGILNSIIDGKSRFALNNGIQPVITEINKQTGAREIKEFVTDAEILDFLEANDSFFQVYGWMKDQVGFAQGVCRYGLNKKKDPKVITFQRDDVTEFRFEKKNTKGHINNIYLAAEWNRIRGIEDPRLIKVPHLNSFNPAADLVKRVKGNGGYQYAITFRYPGWQRHYYSMPLWYAAYKWVKIAQGVPEMKAAIFQNSIHVKYVVIIYEGYWTKAFGATVWKKYTEKQKDDARQKLYDDIDKFLVGSKNAYKSVFTSGYRSPDGKTYTDIEIKPVEDTQKDGKLLPDSAAANSEIAFAMHYNNTILGGNQVQGPYDKGNGGSNIRESVLVQVIHHELERQNVRRNLMVPARFNGWTEKYPGLDFVIPATLLTTLDTGSGTKPIVTGETKKKEE